MDDDVWSVIFAALERGVLFISAMNDFTGEAAEVGLRVADKLVQLSFAAIPHVDGGQDIYQGILDVRDCLRHEIESCVRSTRGCPCVLISEYQLTFYLQSGFTVTKIARFFGCSRRTIERRMRSYGLSVRQMFSSISDNELIERVTSITQHNPALGEKSVDGLLRAQGHIIQRQRICDALWEADPEGVQFRLRNCLRRREYHVESPNSLWHVDGYHKLVRWKIVIHGGIDGYSRLIVYLKAANNNRADTALAAFRKGVSDYGLLSRVRTDRGGENVLIGEYMLQTRGIGRNSIIMGKNVHNQRIERLWRDLFTGCISFFYYMFYQLETDRLLDVDNERDLFTLHTVFLPKFKNNCKVFKTVGLNIESGQSIISLPFVYG